MATAPVGENTPAAQHAAAYALLAEMLRAAGLPTGPIRKTPQARPYLDGAADFSIAHTGTLAVCALCPQGGRVGVDAEPWGKAVRAEALANRFFAPRERAFWQNGDPLRAFYTVFTRKEAFAKYQGDGLAAHLLGTDTMAPDFETTHGVKFDQYDADGHCITVCYHP